MKAKYLVVVLAAALVLSVLLTGCPKETAPDESTRLTPMNPPVGGEAEATEGQVAGEDAASDEVPTGLSGKLEVGVPCGVAMAFKAAQEIILEANPDLKLVPHVKNVAPMTREIIDGKSDLDVFMSLGDREAELLVEAGVVQGEPRPFLRQSIMLAVPVGNPLGIETLEDLTKDEVKTIAVCDSSLSIGECGQKALEAVGIWDELEASGKVIRPNMPKKAKEMVIQGKADAAFVYAACENEEWKESEPELSIIGKADMVLTVPDDLYGGMFAQAVITKAATDPELAAKFIDALRTPVVQEAISKLGYGMLDKADENAQAGTEDCFELPLGTT